MILVEVKYLRVQRSHRILSCLINKSKVLTFTEPEVDLKSHGECAECCIVGAFWKIKDEATWDKQRWI